MRNIDFFSNNGFKKEFKANTNKNERILRGVLTPVGWNTHEEPIEFSLFMADEEDLFLFGPHLLNRFRNLMNKPVEVLGEFKRNQWGDEYFKVKKVKRIKESDYKKDLLEDVHWKSQYLANEYGNSSEMAL